MLLRHLLDVELDFRGGLGESPVPSEYRSRFPGHEGLIDSIFAEFVERALVVRGGYSETLSLLESGGPSSRSAITPLSFSFPNIPGCEILSELGRGGMGVVYKARQIWLNRLCALKILLPGDTDGAEFSVRFLAEAETIARLRHPNIVQIYGFGEHDGRPYFEMEYIPGGSLARRLDGTPWSPAAAARTVAVLARAIGDAHRLGIVHRDLKPANVLLADDDTPKIVDFGLAKLLGADSSLTQSGVFVGTPSYAAPEQVDGHEQRGRPRRRHLRAWERSFYHMLTGRPPFQAATVLQTLEQVRTADPVAPSRLQPGLSRDAETICLKCLEKDPQRRYTDAAALADDLDRYLAGRPILARPTGAVERFRKWIRAGRRWPCSPRHWWRSRPLASFWSPGSGDARKPRPLAEAESSAMARQSSRVAHEKQAQLTFRRGAGPV